MTNKNEISRRKFLAQGLTSGIALPLLGSSLFSCHGETGDGSISGEATGKKLNILILGGTSFLGPHQIAYALERGHSITTFTRGRTAPSIHKDLFERVTALEGDRENDLTALEEGSWDAVIDNSGNRTAWVERSAGLLKERTGLYLYTSSTGVYYPYLTEQADENSEVLLKEPEGITDEEEKLEYWYGVMKATSENAVREAFGDARTIIVRPTYMIGPADKSNRFIHWPVRLARGGEVMIPGKPEDPVQYADVRDVAEFMIRLIEEEKAGTYNAVGPAQPQDMYSFVRKAGEAFDVDHTFVQIDDYDFLKARKLLYIVPWIMPEGNNMGSALISNKKGIDAGLSFRDPVQSVRDTYDWWYSDALTDEQRNKFELDTESALQREKEILAAWKARK